MIRFAYNYQSLNLLILEHDIDQIKLKQNLLKHLSHNNRKSVEQLKLAGLLFYIGNVKQFRITNLEVKNIVHTLNCGLSAVLGIVKYDRGFDYSDVGKLVDSKNRALYYIYQCKAELVQKFFNDLMMTHREFLKSWARYSKLVHQYNNHDYSFVRL